MKPDQIPFISTLTLDPELASAVKRWVDTTQQAWEELNTAQAGINPLPSLLQSGARTTNFLLSLNWAGTLQHPPGAQAYQQIFQELADLLTAATQRVSSDQEALLDHLVQEAGTLLNAPAGTRPQAALASLINKGLDSYDLLKEQLNNQLQTTASIQSALLAWYQQSLTAITGKAQV
jgi:hypothetical protein